MRLVTQSLVAAALCAVSRAAQEQIVLDDDIHQHVRTKNVAIIGAGSAGSSSAYHLSQFAEAAGIPINVTIFEKNSHIGGRSTTVNAYKDSDLPIELGASVFVQLNKILVDAVEAFNLSTSAFISKRGEHVPGAALGVWDGQNFVFTQENEGGWWDTAKLFYRYGLSPLRTLNLMKATVGKFLKMYEEPVFPFGSLTQAAQDVGLLAVTSSTGEDYLKENSIGSLFAREIIQASTRVNYAQNLDNFHGLETMVCMASNGAMSVEGGNWQIFANMVASARASIMLETEVTRVEKSKDGKLQLTSKSLSPELGSRELTSQFDEVILAAPYQYSGIGLAESIPFRKPDEFPYVKLHVTLFTSPHLLSPAFFGLPSDKATPQVIITTLPPDEHPPSNATVGSPGFYSISLLRDMSNPRTGMPEYAYKIFSPSPPNSSFLSSLLGVVSEGGDVSEEDITWMYRKVWHSYPYEYPRDTFEDIKLSEGLWYTSGIERFISTMETSALMGKNVARLIADGWVKGEEEVLGEMASSFGPRVIV